MEVVGTS